MVEPFSFKNPSSLCVALSRAVALRMEFLMLAACHATDEEKRKALACYRGSLQNSLIDGFLKQQPYFFDNVDRTFRGRLADSRSSKGKHWKKGSQAEIIAEIASEVTLSFQESFLGPRP